MRGTSAKFSMYDTVYRIPESEVGNVTFSVLSEPSVSTMDKPRSSKRPIIILGLVFLVATVITGVVVWKVTKDAYDDGDPPKTVNVGDGSNDGQKGSGGGGAGSKDTVPETTQRPITEEELKLKPWLGIRMPRDVLPLHYDITMFPDFYGDGSLFYGNETIQLQVHRATRFILIHIHATYMNVTSTRVTDHATGAAIDVTRTFYHSPNEFWVVELTEELAVPSTVDLVLSFEGSLVKGIVGIYKSTYLDTLKNQTRHITTSKFEPTYARRAFPCFDEPNIKAEYTITLVHKPEYTALSNMPQDGTSTANSDYPGMVSSKFERSVKMSTYLVCYIVCDFQYRNATSDSGVPIRVFATRDKIDQVEYALDLAKHTLDLYEKLFNMSYPLPKQDLIAIPDFVSGAMEHWGLITFRESRLLVDKQKSSLSNIELVSLVIAHEMSHMWFGNIVTMDWWNDLWLNEGFASYMEYLGVDDKHKDWKILDSFLTRDLFPVMGQDSELSSHPIIVDVERPSQITSVFDAISYSKGSSVIRMLMAIMGKDKFFQGVGKYLKEQKWGNARTDDLWRSLSQVKEGGATVKHIMDTWTLQDGFPYVNITMETARPGVAHVTATQKRFMSSPGAVVDPSSSPLGYKWYIALPFMGSNGVEGVKYMDMNDTMFDVTMDLTGSDSWIKFNHGQPGFYRVLYPDVIWTRFSEYLTRTDPIQWVLSGSDRAGLLNDAFSLAAAGLSSYETPLELMGYMSREFQYAPWSAALSGGIMHIQDMFQQDPEFPLWKKFLASQVRPVLQTLEYDDDATQSHLNRTLRRLLMSTACRAEDPLTLENVRSQFRTWLDQGQAPSNELRGIVYHYGISKFGTDADWERLWQMYLVEASPSEKERLADALANAQQPHLIARLLQELKEGKHIKRQDFFTVVRQVGSNPAAVNLVWDWAQENYQSFVERFSITDRYFGRMIYYMVRDYNSEFKLQQVKALFAKFPEAGAGERYRKMALESIEKNIYWMKHFRPIIVNWLKTNA